jgi:hypothetical protein
MADPKNIKDNIYGSTVFFDPPARIRSVPVTSGRPPLSPLHKPSLSPLSNIGLKHFPSQFRGQRAPVNNAEKYVPNNFTSRVRRSVATRRRLYPGLTVKAHGENGRMSLAEAVASLNNKNTRSRVSSNRTLRGNFLKSNVNYRKTVPSATVKFRNRALSPNQAKTFANIFASTNDYNVMGKKISNLNNKSQEYKNALKAHLNYIMQE